MVALIIFPVKFIEEIKARSAASWGIGWAYATGWAGTIFMLGSGILLLIDRDSDELTYAEKTCFYNNDELDDGCTDV